MPRDYPCAKSATCCGLEAGGSSKRKIAASLGISPTAVGECVRRARRACLSWPLPASLDDETLENRLYPPPTITSKNKRPQPDWRTIHHRELKRPGVTCNSSGRSIAPSTPLAMGTAGSAISIGLGRNAYPRPCGKRTWPVRADVRRLCRHDDGSD